MKKHTSQELSQRLHDKGFRGEHEQEHMLLSSGKYMLVIAKDEWPDTIPAYTFTELWGVLPQVLDKPLCTYYLTLHKVHQGTIALYEHPTIGHLWKREPHESPAEAVGLLLEWLIDNNHVEVKG